ncbi:MAG: thioredoxin domain-containing protein [Acidobacteriota bacterium]
MTRRPAQTLFLSAAAALAAIIIGLSVGSAGEVGPAPSADRAAEAPGAVAATVGEHVFSLEEVDARAATRLSKVRMDEYRIRRQVLDAMISERVLRLEAAARDIAVEQLLEQEVTSRVADPTQEEIDAFYAQNRSRYGAQTKEQVTQTIVSVLRSQKLSDRQRAFLRDLRAKYGVRVSLEPPRTRVALDDDAARGPEGAPIVIVEFSDYQCPYCKRAEATVEQVLSMYGDKVRLVYRDYPLSFHKNAQTAAEAAECADEQGKFWQMHKAIFADQSKLATEQLVETAASIGLDADAFRECLDSGRYAEEVRKDLEDGQRYGVTGTPTFFINGIMMVGAKGVDSFAEIIDQELERIP